MAKVFDYYYVGDQSLIKSRYERTKPLFLCFSKIQNSGLRDTPVHMHAFLEIFYFESGEGFLQAGTKTVEVKPGDLIVVNSGCMHVQYSVGENPLTYYCFSVDNVNIEGLPPNSLSDTPYLLRSLPCNNNAFKQNIDKLLEELHTKNYGYYTKVYSIFSELFVDTVRLWDVVPRTEQKSLPLSANDKILEKIREYLQKNYASDISLDSLTKMSLMTKSHFLHLFKARFGISPMQLLNLFRVEHAKLLLTRGNRSIAEVAYSVGINNPVYFAELFKKTIGIPPSSYRRLIMRA